MMSCSTASRLLDMPGGVRDALKATKGMVYGITDREASEARDLFEQSEEIDILNAPASCRGSAAKSDRRRKASPRMISYFSI